MLWLVQLPCLSLEAVTRVRIDVLQVSAGYSHTCAILDDDTLKCWGYGGDGQLGYGDGASKGNTPLSMGNLSAVSLPSTPVLVECGNGITFVLLDNNEVRQGR